MDKKELEKWETYAKIVTRAEDLLYKESKGPSRLSLFMDVELADKKYRLRLQEWLNSDDRNFLHDWLGIQQNINRREKTFNKYFIPRFAQGGF